MLVLQAKHVRILLLVLIGLTGLSAGYFCAQLSGFFLQPPAGKTTPETAVRATAASPARVNTTTILEKNIFDPAARGKANKSAEPDTVEPVRTTTNSNLKLFGTVDGGDNPLALIESAGKVRIYRVGADLPGGGELLSVARNEAIVRQADGSQAKLIISRPESS